MLYNLLLENSGRSIRDPNMTSLFEQYEKQRQHFINRRIGEIKNSYGLTEDEKNVLLGFFNTFERESKNTAEDNPSTFHLLSTFKQHKIEEELIENNPGYLSALGWLRIYWSGAWRQFATYNKYTLSARFAINNNRINTIKEQYYNIAIEDLISDLKGILPRAEKSLGLPLTVDDVTDPDLDDNGILELDKKKLKWLRQNNVGKSTKQYISEFDKLLSGDNYNIEHRLDVWDNPLYFTRAVAELRWKDCIANLIQRKQSSAPALTYQFYNQVSGILKRDNSLNETGTEILSKEGRVISAINKAPSTTISTIEQITKSNIPALASITSHYLWRWFIENAHKQHLLDQEQPYRFEFIGGYPKLGELSGAGTSSNTRERIKTIIAISSGCG